MRVFIFFHRGIKVKFFGFCIFQYLSHSALLLQSYILFEFALETVLHVTVHTDIDVIF